MSRRSIYAFNRRHGFGSTASHHGAQLRPYAWPIPSIGGTPRRHISPRRRRMDAAWGRGRTGRSLDPRRASTTRWCRASGQPTRWRRRRRHARGLPLCGSHASATSSPSSHAPRGSAACFSIPASRLCSSQALEENGCIRDIFVDLVAGLQPYRGLRRRLLTKLQWSLAARAIPMLLQPGFTGTMSGVALSPGNVTRS